MPAARSWLLPYVALAVIWGLSFAFIKSGLAALTPLQVTAARLGLGALAVVLWLAITRSLPRPSGAELWRLTVLGTIGLAVPFALIAFAETRVTSVLAGLLNAATPLFAAIFVSILIPTERPSRLQVIGLATGFVGIGVLVGAWDLGGTGADVVGIAAMIAATICYGFGTAFGRAALRNTTLVGPQLTVVQLLAGTALLALLLPVDPGADPGPLTWQIAIAVLILGSIGTGAAMVMFWRILREAGATVAATVTYVIPLVSTTVGVLVLHEGLLWHQVAGGLIVIVGVVATQWPQLTGSGVRADPLPPDPGTGQDGVR